MTDDVVELPMFPLGTVLFPAMPLPLRIFEPRYLQLLADVLDKNPAEFGVVLIERGHEVGGGDQRFSLGTTARIVEMSAEGAQVGVLAQGGRRFEVVEWLDDAPYPRAMVRMLPELEWDEQWRQLRDDTEELVRNTMIRAGEFGDHRWSPTVDLIDDPVASLWQLAGIASLGELDRMRLLGATTAEGLLKAIDEATRGVAETLGT